MKRRRHSLASSFLAVTALTVMTIPAAARPLARPPLHANGRIAFLYRGGIYTILPNGRSLRKLAGGDRYGRVIYHDIAWSHDGKQLAATDSRALYVMRADGSHRRIVLTRGEDEPFISNPAWSPRGTEIAISRLPAALGDPTASIEIIRFTDKKRTRIAAGSFPSWTPDVLPLAWLTGFFGQNFGYLVKSIGGWESFVGIGVGTELIALAILLAFFRRRGWF
jgi:hypothetical protein